jgi:hypothetical protein
MLQPGLRRGFHDGGRADGWLPGAIGRPQLLRRDHPMAKAWEGRS